MKLHFILIGLLAFTSSACGNKGQRRSNDTSILKSSQSHIVDVDDPNAESYFLNEYFCQAGQVVQPDSDPYLDGSGKFKICQSNTTTDRILIQGSLHDSQTAAVFPAKYIDNNHVMYKPEIGAQPLPGSRPGEPNLAPYMREVSLKSLTSGVFSIASADYNFVFIVSIHDSEKMKECLIKGQYDLCPVYSFGKFR